MPLTTDDLAKVCIANGIDTPEAFDALIKAAAGAVRVTSIDSEIARVLVARDKAIQAFEVELQALQAEKAAAERARDGVE